MITDPRLPRDLTGLVNRLYVVFREVFAELNRLTYRGEATVNPPSIAAGGTTILAVPCVNARLGDSVRVFPPYSLQGIQCSAYVSADDSVSIVLVNPTGSAIDLAQGLWRVSVEKYI